MDTKNLSFEVKVGIFILVGLVILILMVFSIGDIYFIRPGYHIKAIFNFANGIAMNAPVRLAGIEVGEVDGIRLYYDSGEGRTKVELAAWIKKDDMLIESDSKAVINTLGMLGEKYLEIYPGKNKDFLKEGGMLAGKDPVSMEDMTFQIKQVADSITVITERLKNGEGTIGKFLTDDSIYNNLEDFTADIKTNPWKLMNRPK